METIDHSDDMIEVREEVRRFNIGDGIDEFALGTYGDTDLVYLGDNTNEIENGRRGMSANAARLVTRFIPDVIVALRAFYNEWAKEAHETELPEPDKRNTSADRIETFARDIVENAALIVDKNGQVIKNNGYPERRVAGGTIIEVDINAYPPGNAADAPTPPEAYQYYF